MIFNTFQTYIHSKITVYLKGLKCFMKYYNPDLSVPEIFNLLEKSPGTVTEKVQLLKRWDRRDVKFVIDIMYNGDITKGKIGVLPAYKASTKPMGANFMTLNSALPSITSALNMLHSDNFNQQKFDRSIKLVLESISAQEAELLVEVLMGKKFRGNMKTIIKEAFPSFFRANED